MSRTDDPEKISIYDIDKATQEADLPSSSAKSGYTGRIARDSSMLFGRHHGCGPNCKQPCEMPLYRSREAFLAGVKTGPVLLDTGTPAPPSAEELAAAGMLLVPTDSRSMLTGSITEGQGFVTLDKICSVPPATTLDRTALLQEPDDSDANNSLLQGYIGLNQALQNEINALKKQNRVLRDERDAALASKQLVTAQLDQLKTLINRITA